MCRIDQGRRDGLHGVGLVTGIKGRKLAFQEVISQGCPCVALPEAAALQFGHDEVGKFFEATGK